MVGPDDPATPKLGTLLALAWPLVISRASQVVVGLCDAVMVADLGAAALAATTTGAMNAFALFILPMGIVFIVSSFSSQLFGRGDLAGARRYGFYGLAVGAAAAVSSLLAIAATSRVLALFPYAPDVRAQMTDYVELRLLSAGAVVGMEALSNYYGGLGNTRLPMFANVAAMVLNVIGNWLLIKGHLGAPAMGVAGAALASTLSTFAAFGGLLLRFLLDGRELGAVVPRLSWQELRRMLRFGVPSGLNWFFEFMAFSFFINVVVAGLGTTALAALMAVIQINSVSFMPAFGLASAGAILVGQTIGAGAKDAVPAVVRLTFGAAATWQGIVGLAYFAVPGWLLLAFAPPGPDAAELLDVGASMLALSAGWQLFDAVANTIGEALRAIGDTAFVLWARVAVAWLVFAPGAYVTVRYLHGGHGGAVLWLILYIAILAGVLFLRFRGGAWRNIELVEPVV